MRTIADDGQTDCVAFVHRFGARSVIGEMDCVYSSRVTAHASGFAEAEVAALRRVFPLPALAIKCVSQGRSARTLVGVYLGHDAGDKVLSGRISRGVAERINAVIWYSDLAAVAPEPERSALVSVARYALRGVGRAQEFVTPDPAHG